MFLKLQVAYFEKKVVILKISSIVQIRPQIGHSRLLIVRNLAQGVDSTARSTGQQTIKNPLKDSICLLFSPHLLNQHNSSGPVLKHPSALS